MIKLDRISGIQSWKDLGIISSLYLEVSQLEKVALSYPKSKVDVGTLLNRLFSTKFDVMDETNRKQTTKGYCHY